jgi:lipopolysaccharide/colanic/teichoic acid biosynthesis glycosyltransferase
MKHVLDRFLGAMMLVVTLSIILVSLFLIWVSSGCSPWYSQKRLGHRGRIVTIYKIRTMYQDCERDSGPVWSLPGDPRVTTIGRCLRWTHIDELPQLLNVVRGETSLIGPRPERPEIAAWLEGALPGYSERLQIRPGLSGLVQVLEPPDTDLGSVRRKLSYDLFNVNRMCFWLDLRITLATVMHLMHVPGNWIAGMIGFPQDMPRVEGQPHRRDAALFRKSKIQLGPSAS